MDRSSSLTFLNKIDWLFEEFNGSYLILGGVIISLLFLCIAVVTYAAVYPFSCFSNFVSDLGVGPYSSRITFALGGILMTASYVGYFLLLSRYIQRKGGNSNIILIASLFSLLYALSLLVVSIVPFDSTNELAYNIHLLGAILLFLCQAGGGFSYGISELSIKKLPKLLPLTSFSSAFLAGMFAVIFSVQSLTATPYQLFTYVSEWLAVFGFILWTSVHGTVILKSRHKA